MIYSATASLEKWDNKRWVKNLARTMVIAVFITEDGSHCFLFKWNCTGRNSLFLIHHESFGSLWNFLPLFFFSISKTRPKLLLYLIMKIFGITHRYLQWSLIHREHKVFSLRLIFTITNFINYFGWLKMKLHYGIYIYMVIYFSDCKLFSIFMKSHLFFHFLSNYP